MEQNNLEFKCKKAIISIADNVRDINYKLSHFLENYREDYYNAVSGINYEKRF